MKTPGAMNKVKCSYPTINSMNNLPGNQVDVHLKLFACIKNVEALYHPLWIKIELVSKNKEFTGIFHIYSNHEFGTI